MPSQMKSAGNSSSSNFSAVLKRIVPLCERHGAGVEPAVHDLRDPVHGLAAVRTCEMSRRPHTVCAVRWSHRWLVCLCNQLFSAADAFQMSAFASPDWNRRAPVSVSGDRPVLDLFQPVAETLLADEIRDTSLLRCCWQPARRAAWSSRCTSSASRSKRAAFRISSSADSYARSSALA